LKDKMNTKGLRLLLSIAFCLHSVMVSGQVLADAPLTPDTAGILAVPKDSATPLVAKPAIASSFLSGEVGDGPYGTRVGTYMDSHPYFGMRGKPVGLPHLERHVPAVDWIFYVFTGSLFLLGLTRVLFPGYLEALLRGVFGNSTLRGKHDEGLMSQGVASLWMNLLFLVNGALFLHFLFSRSLPDPPAWNPWQWMGFWMLVLAAVYLVKYAVLLSSGWVFGLVRQAHEYMSIVFQVNRLASIFLVLCSIPLALVADRSTLLPIVWLFLSILLVMRLVRAFEYFRKSMDIGLVAYLILFLSFEVLPLLLLRKALSDLFL
jgi:hypothetical protein